MSLKLAARLVTVEPYKIADIIAADTLAHITDLSTILPKETKAILIRAENVVGNGAFRVFPMSGPTYFITAGETSQKCTVLVPIKNRELKWKLGAANDEKDLILYGYFVQKKD